MNKCRHCGSEFPGKGAGKGRVAEFCSAKCRKKDFLQRLRAEGLCEGCFKVPARAGRTTCQECSDKNSARVMKRYTARKAAGLCSVCGKPKERPDRIQCQSCSDTHNSSQLAKQRSNRDVGVCIRCGKESCEEGNRQCQECLDYTSQHFQKQKHRVLSAYSDSDHPRCRCCGEDWPIFLTLDHIAGGGNEHRRTIGRSEKDQRSVYRHVIKEGFPPGFQVLCFNCNFAKHALGTCPHQQAAVES